MRNPFKRRKPPKEHFVRLTFEDGDIALLGPMDRFVAEVLVVNGLAHNPFHFKRRVASARITGERE